MYRAVGVVGVFTCMCFASFFVLYISSLFSFSKFCSALCM